MQTTISMQKLALNDIITNDISNLLDTKITNLMCFNYLFRMDPPFCKRNSLDWHQDFVDYDQKDMSDGITAWIPLIDINNVDISNRNSNIKDYNRERSNISYKLSDMDLRNQALRQENEKIEQRLSGCS
jgi:hypothetical protein